jgi:hypothetical protein
MGSFSDLFNAFELIEKQQKEITKLKEKNSEKYVEIHTKDYKIITEDSNHTNDYIRHSDTFNKIKEYAEEPLIVCIHNSAYPTFGCDSAGMQMEIICISNAGSIYSMNYWTANTLHDSKIKEIRRNILLSDKKIDLIRDLIYILCKYEYSNPINNGFYEKFWGGGNNYKARLIANDIIKLLECIIDG